MCTSDNSVTLSYSWTKLGDFIRTCSSPIDLWNIYSNCAEKTQKRKSAFQKIILFKILHVIFQKNWTVNNRYTKCLRKIPKVSFFYLKFSVVENKLHHTTVTYTRIFSSVQFSSVTQSCPTLWNPMNRSTPGLPVHHQLPEFTQTHVHWVSDAIQPSHPLSSPPPPAPNPSQHQSLFHWHNSSHELAKVLEFQL